MYNGDRSRKTTLVEYGFRLPSALDNRPLKFEEFEKKLTNVICCSATPGDYELNKTNNQKVEQIIRPTGLLDPLIEVRSNDLNPISDVTMEVKKRKEKGERSLIVTLTIKDAENLTDYLKNKGIKVAYLQHEIQTMERSEIIYKLRKGDLDCVVGINLLREGLDIPEVSMIAILNADKEGFLRSERSLIQIVGRAARNDHGKVIMYSDIVSDSMKNCIAETNRRRQIQEAYNKENNITPKTIIKPVTPPVRLIDDTKKKTKRFDGAKMSKKETEKVINELTKQMKQAAKDLDFEKAALLRDEIMELRTSLE